MNRKKLRGIELKIDSEFIQIIKDVLEYFHGDVMKTKLWLTTENPQFGFIAPLALIAMKRGHKVQAMIDEAKESWAKPREWTIEANSQGQPFVTAGPNLPLGIKLAVREVLLQKGLTPEKSGDETVINNGDI